MLQYKPAVIKKLQLQALYSWPTDWINIIVTLCFSGLRERLDALIRSGIQYAVAKL